MDDMDMSFEWVLSVWKLSRILGFGLYEYSPPNPCVQGTPWVSSASLQSPATAEESLTSGTF